MLVTSARRTDATESGSSPDWHTPQASEGSRRTYKPTPAQMERGHGGYLSTQVLWATPNTGLSETGHARRGGQPRNGRQSGQSLDTQVLTFLTPNSRDWKDHGPTQGKRKSPNLGTVAQWPTPSATAYGSSNNGCPHDGREEYATKGKPSLERMAAWPTATAQDGRNTGQRHSPNANPGTSLTDAVNGDVGPQAQASRSMSGSRRAQLNPRWVEALMGYPVGWLSNDASVSLPPSATPSSRKTPT